MAKKVRYPFDIHTGPRRMISFYPIECAVLAFDVVGYTKGTTHQNMIKILQGIDNAINAVMYEDFNWNEIYEEPVEGENRHNDVVMIPTGDGYAIAFLPDIDRARILDVARALSQHMSNNRISVRMGLAFGPGMVNPDQNNLPNVFGYNINTATRVMNLGNARHILAEHDFADPLLARETIAELHDVGLFTVKATRVKIYNYYKRGEFGNPRRPTRPKHR